MPKTGKNKKSYDYKGMSAFCLQISLLISAAVPLSDGLTIMAEDASEQWEKDLLMNLADSADQGMPFDEALKQTGVFSNYMIHMVSVGQTTGNLDTVMESLSEFYEKEANQKEMLKNALTYPCIMITMLLVVMYVLFSKVMPVFKDVYSQMGASLSPVTMTAMHMGSIISGALLVILAILVIIVLITAFFNKIGIKTKLADTIIKFVKDHSKIAKDIALRRFSFILAMTLKSGLPIERGFALAGEVIDQKEISAKIKECIKYLDDGENYYDIMKNSKLFSGFHIQMIKVGNRSGRLDEMMSVISADYEEQAERSMGNIVTAIEPTVVAILAICVGMVLLSVMVPLVGLLANMG